MSSITPIWTVESASVELDSVFGTAHTQLTSAPVISNNIYCEQPYCSADGKRIAFVRFTTSGYSASSLWVADLATNKLAHIDERVSNIATAKYSGMIYYQKRDENGTKKMMRLDLNKLALEEVFDLSEVPEFRTIGSISSDHRYYVNMCRKEKTRCRIIRLDLVEKSWKFIHEEDEIINPHPQISPGTDELMIQHNRGCELDETDQVIRLVGDIGATLYVIDLEGGNRRNLPAGKPWTNPATGHECWVGDTGYAAYTVGTPHQEALRTGNLFVGLPGSEEAIPITSAYRLNHLSVSRCGRFFVADHGCKGMPLVVGSLKTGRSVVLCKSHTSQARPQYIHTHPYFTSDNRRVIFNSDRSGVPQIYAASVPDGLLEGLDDEMGIGS